MITWNDSWWNQGQTNEPLERPEKELRSIIGSNLWVPCGNCVLSLVMSAACEWISELLVVESNGYGWFAFWWEMVCFHPSWKISMGKGIEIYVHVYVNLICCSQSPIWIPKLNLSVLVVETHGCEWCALIVCYCSWLKPWRLH